MEKLVETRIDAAIRLRKNLGLPSAHTNAFRLVNSEGDRYYILSFVDNIMQNGHQFINHNITDCQVL